MLDLTPEEQELKATWSRLLDEIERRRKDQAWRLDQRLYRKDLGLGYLIYCARRFANRSQAEIGRRMGSVSQSTVSKWERGNRLPSVSALGVAADVCGLELIIGLRNPNAKAIENEFLLLAAYKGEGVLPDLDVFYDKYQHDYIPPRPWRKALERPSFD